MRILNNKMNYIDHYPFVNYIQIYLLFRIFYLNYRVFLLIYKVNKGNYITNTTFLFIKEQFTKKARTEQLRPTK